MLKEFHTPDSIWKAFNIHSHEEYMGQIFVKGNFHSKVPEPIINEFKKAERVLCYAYYNYPLIDEAFSISTKIFEGAIVLRLNELKLSKRGNLESKILRLGNYSSKNLLNQWNYTRKIRNMFAHPDPGTLMGITLVGSFRQMVNIINTIFLSKEEIDNNDKELKDLKAKTSPLNEGLFKLVSDDKAYLVYSALVCAVTDSVNKQLWVFHPVLNEFPQTMEKAAFSKPIIKWLKDIRISDDGITGTDMETERAVVLIKTKHPKNLESHRRFQMFFNSADEIVRCSFELHNRSEIGKEVVKFTYDEYWS